MKAELEPLDGKYYGTEIKLTFDDGGEDYIVLWDSGNGELSIREIEARGYTKEQYDKNELIDDGWGGKGPIKSIISPEDTHFESETTYNRALEIVRLINRTD